MPIEFRCTKCAKLLRTGDDTVGKQAKCPACQTIVTVPSAGQAATQPQQDSPSSDSPSSDSPSPGSPFDHSENASGASPFGSANAGQGYAAAGPQADSGNPYQAPAEYATPSGYGAVAATGEIRPSEIDFGEAFNRTWASFTDQLGMCILVVFLCGVMGQVAGYAAQFMGLLVGVAAGQEAVGVIVNIFLIIPVVLFSFWLKIGQSIFFLKVSRGQKAPISDIFSGGPYLLRVLGASVMLGAGLMAMLLIGCLPGLAVVAVGLSAQLDALTMLGALVAGIGGGVAYSITGLMFFQFYYLIVDRNMGIMESFSTSRKIMVGNKGITFLIFLVSVILGALFGISTCLIGFLAVAPFMGILYAVLYLLATGQPTMSDYREMQYQQQAQPQQ